MKKKQNQKSIPHFPLTVNGTPQIEQIPEDVLNSFVSILELKVSELIVKNKYEKSEDETV